MFNLIFFFNVFKNIVYLLSFSHCTVLYIQHKSDLIVITNIPKPLELTPTEYKIEKSPNPEFK